MTKKSKIILLSATLLAVCVLLSAVLFFFGSYQANGATDSASILYVAGIVLLSILSVLFVYLAKVRKSNIEKLLDAPYYVKYEIMKDGLLKSQLSAKKKNEIREDILDLLLSAQTSGKPVDNAVEDPAAFVRNIIEVFSKPHKTLILSLIGGAVTSILFIILLTVFSWLEETGSNFFSAEIPISMLIMALLIAFLIIPATTGYKSVKHFWLYLLPLGFGIIYILTLEMLRATLYNTEAVRVFLDGSIAVITSPLVLLMYLVSLLVLTVSKTLIRKRMIRN